VEVKKGWCKPPFCCILLWELQMINLVYINQHYTDYLYRYDFRVSKNIDIAYQRAYCGILFEIKHNLYFAPLTSSGKGKKLKEHPKRESPTFYPIRNCQLGGININNMIPVVNGVFHKIIASEIKDRIKRTFIQEQLIELRKNERHIISKARKLYDRQINGTLFPNYAAVTCDFKKLEQAATRYNADESKTVKTSLHGSPARLSAGKKVLIEKQIKTQEKTVTKTMVLEPKNKPKKRPVNYK
jgi:hypothetical protein